MVFDLLLRDGTFKLILKRIDARQPKLVVTQHVLERIERCVTPQLGSRVHGLAVLVWGQV